MTDEGEFEEVEINGSRYKGKGLMDYLDDQVRKAYIFLLQRPRKAAGWGI